MLGVIILLERLLLCYLIRLVRLVGVEPATVFDQIRRKLQFRSILIGTAGDARIIDADGNDSGATDLVPLPAGILPVGFKRIYSTGLTAARIWAIY